MIGITSKTRKMLWGRAGARCSFEGCQIELIELTEGESRHAILGEEAHIIAQKKDGARGENPIEPQRINLYENLILLCPTHHTLVDAQATKYTVQVLHQMKKAHESWVDRNLGGRNRAEEFHYLPDPVYAHFCRHRLIHLWKYPKAHVLCCSYGSDPVEILSGIWKGSGIEFHRFPGAKVAKVPEYMLNISEAEPEVEYRCDAEALEVTSYTYDPRVAGFTAFMTMRFEHDRPIEGRLLTLRLVPEIAPIEPVLKYLRLPRDSAKFETIEKNLFRLRNIGLSTPRQALEWTRELRGSWWCDGDAAESLTNITKQLEMVVEAEQVE
jgi:hypothetical protein